MENDHQLEKLLIVKQISPCQHLMKCIEDGMENMQTDVRVYMMLYDGT